MVMKNKAEAEEELIHGQGAETEDEANAAAAGTMNG
jgi:hypothetical protein